MNCIDCVEGVIKDVIVNIHGMFIDERQDDTEYIRNIKAVIFGADSFIQNNRELVGDPKLLEKVLYAFARQLWLETPCEVLEGDPAVAANKEDEGETTEGGCENAPSPYDDKYYKYYFDYIYNHGVYPP